MNKRHVVKYTAGGTRFHERFATRPEADARAAEILVMGAAVSVKSEPALPEGEGAARRYPLTCHRCRHQQHEKAPCEECGAPAEMVHM